MRERLHEKQELHPRMGRHPFVQQPTQQTSRRLLQSGNLQEGLQCIEADPRTSHIQWRTADPEHPVQDPRRQYDGADARSSFLDCPFQSNSSEDVPPVREVLHGNENDRNDFHER